MTHTFKVLAAGLLAVMVGACASPQGGFSTTSASVPPGASSAPGLVCKHGDNVHYDASTFHIDVLVAEDGARAEGAVSDAGNDAGKTLYKTVGRYFGPMTLTYYINSRPSRLPSHLPVLIGKGFCFGMMKVLPDEPGWSKVVVSVPGKTPGGLVVNGQVALVLPPAPLLELKDGHGGHLSPEVAVQLNIPTKYNAPITKGRFAGWPDTQIVRSEKGISRIEQRIRAGERASLFYFVHGRN
jgi:hypothetical protein